MCTNSELTIPSSFATSPFSIWWSKKARSSCLSFSNAAKVYFNNPSVSLALSQRSAKAISDHSELGEVAAGVRVLRTECRPERVDLGKRPTVRLDVELR